MQHFKRITTAAPEGKINAVVMGRKTWQSLPKACRPLVSRKNVVVSRTTSQSEYPDGVLVTSSVSDAVREVSLHADTGDVYIIGGGKIYEEALALSSCTRLYVTRVSKDFECDAFFPAVDESIYKPIHVSATFCHGEIPFDFLVYQKITAEHLDGTPLLQQVLGEKGSTRHEEYQYLDAIKDIIENGVAMGDRTGVGTISMFGKMMRFNLRNSFPLLTTKRVFWRGVVEELLWFIKGDTNGKHLSEKGVKIWDGNGSREFLDSRGLGHREEGDLGPVYGFQWRHFGAKYVDMHTDYTGQGVDQLAECIRKIKTDPTDRRILLSAWNPADLDMMALPPCHMFCQFYVANGELSCLMYQRSCDMGLGVPFNIASYSLLTCMIAQVCDLKPGEFVHTMGNSHVYSNHVDPLKTQMERNPRPFPLLRINPDVKDVDGFEAADFEIIGYDPHKKIAMDMAV